MPSPPPHVTRAANPGAGSVLAPDVDASAQAPAAAPGAPPPDLGRTAAALASPANRSAALTVLAVLAVLYTLYFAREFLRPVTVAVLLNFLLSPVVRALSRARIPTGVGAALVVLALAGAVGSAGYALADPVERWAGEAPAALSAAQRKVRGLVRPVQQVTRTAERVGDVGAVVGPPAGGAAARPTEVVVRGPSLLARAFGTTQRLLAALLEVTVLLYFLLAAGDLFVQKLVAVLPRPGAKTLVVDVARAVESAVSTYLLTTAALNVGEGLVVAGVLALLGVPGALAWGGLLAVLEFVPYLGAATMVALLAVAGLTTARTVGAAFVAPAAFLAVNLVWANVVVPLLLARRLTLNAVAVVVGLAFWFFVWGLPGAFLAVPLLATLKTVCDHVDALAPVGAFLGGRDPRERRATVRDAPRPAERIA